MEKMLIIQDVIEIKQNQDGFFLICQYTRDNSLGHRRQIITTHDVQIILKKGVHPTDGRETVVVGILSRPEWSVEPSIGADAD